MVPLMTKWRQQASQMATRGAQRGRRQKAWNLRFAAPPQGEQGVIEATHHALQNLHSSAGLSTAAGPSQKSLKSYQFSRLTFSAFFFMQNLLKLSGFQHGPLLEAQIRQNRAKSPPRKQSKKHIRKVCRNHAKSEAQHLPNQAFRLKWSHFLSFAASAKKCSK